MKNSTCASRYVYRQNAFRHTYTLLPWARHHVWWLLHNCVAHPLLGVFPWAFAIWLHDKTSQHLNLRKKFARSDPPVIQKRWSWISHNVFGHLLIGLFPFEWAFTYHDKTAIQMNVPDWV